MIAKIIYIGIALTFLESVCANSQTLIPTSDLGARNVALGNSNMSEAHDMSCMYENPATIAFLGTPSVVLNFSQGNFSETQGNIAFPLIYDQSQMLAFGAELYTVGGVIKSSAPRRSAIGYAFTYARKVASDISVGGSVYFVRGVVPQQGHASAASYSLGFNYTPNPDVNYGLALSGLGTGVDFVDGEAGVAAVQSTLPRVLEGGASMRFPTVSSLQPPYLILSLASEKVFGRSGVNYKGGIEFLPVHFLALRLGYVSGPSIHQLRYGIGLQKGLFSVNFAVYPAKVGNTNVLYAQASASMEL